MHGVLLIVPIDTNELARLRTCMHAHCQETHPGLQIFLFFIVVAFAISFTVVILRFEFVSREGTHA